MSDMQDFVKERNAAFLSLDKKKIIKFMEKYEIPFRHLNEADFGDVIHKTILLVINSATEEQKARSAMWLAEHGFSTEIT